MGFNGLDLLVVISLFFVIINLKRTYEANNRKNNLKDKHGDLEKMFSDQELYGDNLNQYVRRK